MSAVRQTAVGVFDKADQADAAIRDLRRLGVSDDQIHLVSGDLEPHRRIDPASTTDAVQGAGVGMLVGASLGGLAGLAPGAAAGAVAGGLIGAFIGLGVPEEEAAYYQDQFQAGRFIVAVNSDGRYDEAADVLRRHGGRVGESPLSDTGPGVLP